MLNSPPIAVPSPSARSPAASGFWVTLRPQISPSARNMPVDSIMVTNITRSMVRIITGSKIGIPKCSGLISANHSASATLSKCIIPIAMARMPPATIPSSTAMLPMKPRM